MRCIAPQSNEKVLIKFLSSRKQAGKCKCKLPSTVGSKGSESSRHDTNISAFLARNSSTKVTRATCDSFPQSSLTNVFFVIQHVIVARRKMEKQGELKPTGVFALVVSEIGSIRWSATRARALESL